MTVSDFINKWRQSTRTERSASQEHFLDLCEVFEHPKPAERPTWLDLARLLELNLQRQPAKNTKGT